MKEESLKQTQIYPSSLTYDMTGPKTILSSHLPAVFFEMKMC